jgi:6-phosphogluconolactonase
MSQNKIEVALVGNFGFGPGPKGVCIYSYDPATANMDLIESAFEDVNVGHISVDDERGIVYLVNECPSQRGQTGGGGYLMALKIDPHSGKLSLINEKPTLSQEPCYTCLDKTKRYIIVSHHADFGFVTKVAKGEQGYSTRVVFDDTALVLFPINEDGSLGDVCDVSITPGDGAPGPHPWARHHSVVADPSGELFIVCDKGLEQFHTYHLDRPNGKLIRLRDTIVKPGLIPRYGTFHPTLPLFYANYERAAVIHAYHYDIATGGLDRVDSAPLMLPEKVVDLANAETSLPLTHPKTLAERMQMLQEKAPAGLDKAEPADILIHPNGKYLYASVRGTNTISVLDVDTAGMISLREVIDCGGVNPRGLTISPDGRFLFAANMNSGNVATFSIGADGMLRATGAGVKASSPGSMRIVAI